MDYKKSKLILDICVYITIAFCVVTVIWSVLWPINFLGLAVLFVGFFQAFIFYRCPHCDKSLDFRGKMPQYCPECGHKLQD